MNINVEQVLQAVQLVVLLSGFGGMAFSLGRVFGRIELLEKSQADVKSMLSGGEDGGGIFLRRSEATLMLSNSNQIHEAFDRRLEDFNNRLGRLEEKGP